MIRITSTEAIEELIAAAVSAVREEAAEAGLASHHRIRSLDAEVERCRREHTGLRADNGRLHATNVRLAHLLEQAETKLEQALLEVRRADARVELWRRQLADAGLDPRIPPGDIRMGGRS